MYLTFPFHIDRLQYFCERGTLDLVYLLARKAKTPAKWKKKKKKKWKRKNCARKSFLLSNSWLFSNCWTAHIYTYSRKAQHCQIYTNRAREKKTLFVYMFARFDFFLLSFNPFLAILLSFTDFFRIVDSLFASAEIPYLFWVFHWFWNPDAAMSIFACFFFLSGCSLMH